ncbi:preprotein translocase subunit YajC [Polyangium sp. 15x6]|uniref:preprotein translocase subunit YajC n=1 Tax=Polyangium sp. 15x6 TaxID=3042687 RepID=UPI00249BD171|nr:preprotein translocase subunit YajC [Polyangium sp. 15x6]MDI3284029.1 preprotein translocase subunit YajC [Polyangium sp. 15x6]
MTTLFLSQPTTVSPGQGAPPAPAPAQPSQGAPTQTPEGGGGGGQPFGGMTILFFLLPLLFVFLMTRNQSKKQKELEAALKPGDKVVTQAGLIGKLIEVGDRTVKLEIAPGVNVQVLKAAIQGVDGEPKPAAEAKDKAQEKKA